MAANALVAVEQNEIAFYDQSYQVLDPQSHPGFDAEGGGMVEYHYPPAGRHDELGRLLKDPQDIIDPETVPEDVGAFVSKWQKQQLSALMDWVWTTKFVWPDVQDRVVVLKRLDIFQQDSPLLQYSTTDSKESAKVRKLEGWYPVRSIFFMDAPVSNSCQLLLEVAGPPRRSKYRLLGKQNKRDLVQWAPKEPLHCFLDPHAALGTSRVFVDYCDLPDRYFLSTDREAGLGMRRLYQCAAYTATQYYILEKRVYHELLDSEGGWGSTYYIEAGPFVQAKKDWRLIGSFFGFDQPLPSSCKFTVYRRTDPFPRVNIAREVIQNAHEWSADFEFYAFDIAVPGTTRYSLHHCLRSIHTNKASVPRHRLTTEDHRLPWEFRMNIFVFPAALDDCTVHPYVHRVRAADGSMVPMLTNLAF